MNNVWIRLAYAALLAVAVALTVGFGVTMAVPGPHPPDTPSLTFRELQSGTDDTQNADRLIAVVDRFYQDAYDFRRAYPAYQRNVLAAMVLCGLIVGAVGIVLSPAFNYLRLGLIVGAVIILVTGARFATAATPNPAPTSSSSITNLLAAGIPPGLDFAGRFLRFAVSFVALLVFLFLGVWRLTEWAPAAQRGDPADGSLRTPASESSPRGADPTGIARSSGESLLWRRPDAE